MIRSLIANFRNLLVARVDPALLARDLAPEDAKTATERAQGVTQPTIVRALRVLSDAASLARTGGNPRLELETALLRFVLEGNDEIVIPSVAPSTVVTPSVAQRSRGAREAPAASPLVTPSVAQRSRGAAEERRTPLEEPVPTPVPKADAGPVTVQKLRAAWQNIRGKVEHAKAPLRVPLSGAMVDAIDGNAAVIKLRSKLDVDILKEHVKLLEDALNDVLGTQLKVRLEVGAAPVPAPAAKEDAFIPESEPESADELFGYASERIK